MTRNHLGGGGGKVTISTDRKPQTTAAVKVAGDAYRTCTARTHRHSRYNAMTKTEMHLPGGHKHCPDVASRLFLSGCSSPMAEGYSANCRCMAATAASSVDTRRSIVLCTCHAYTTTARHRAAAPTQRPTADARRTAADCRCSATVWAAMCTAVIMMFLVFGVVLVVVTRVPFPVHDCSLVCAVTVVTATGALSDLLEIPAGSDRRHRFKHYTKTYRCELRPENYISLCTHYLLYIILDRIRGRKNDITERKKKRSIKENKMNNKIYEIYSIEFYRKHALSKLL